MDFWSTPRKDHQQLPEPQPKRISTPAGQRLSVILENADSSTKARDPKRTSARKSGLSVAAFGEAPRESLEDSNNSSGYSFSVWSDNEKFNALRNHKQITKRGGWKRLGLILLIVLIVIIALGVGLGVGLKKKKSSSSSSTNALAAEATKTANPTPTTSLSPTSTPSSFPLGTYSLVTFLDTVSTNCTSNAATWTCYPYTIYNTDPNKALATFNWIITSSSSGNYQISSTTNPFSINFTNTNLELLDEGQDSERYHFQLQQTKTVSPSTSLTEDNSAVECDFDNTSLQAFLYTKMAKTYPNTTAGQSDGNPSYPEWPYAVRVEQAVGGGENVPSCYKINSDGSKGDSVSANLTTQAAGNLCDCLYRNWRTS